MSAKPISFDDLGGKPVGAAPPGIDFSDLGGKRVSATAQAAPSTPSTLQDSSPMADPGAGKPYQEPETKGPLHQVGGFLQGAGENIAGAVKGVHDLFQGPQNDDEKAIQEKLSLGASDAQNPSLGSRLALAGYRFLHGVNDTMNQVGEAGKKGAQEAKDSGSNKAGILTDMENEPFIGKATKLAEQGEHGKALGDLLTSVLAMRAGRSGAEALPEEAAAATKAIPEATKVAGTTLPETVGQAASRANPAGIGTDIKGVEDVARKIPGSEGLRGVSTEQQGAARTILADKAREAVPGNQQTFSAAPDSIEQNAANAAESARQAGSTKYEEIGKSASNADFTKAVEAAHSILQDDGVAKLLPKSARDALGKVATSLSEREEIAQQIYGKAFNDLAPAKQAEVSKAMQSAPSKTSPITDALAARSELGAAANSARDAADARQLHMAHDQMGQAINESLSAHDAATGSSHVTDLAEADKLWSQKYAFENFRDKLQDIMRDQPHTGNREINGAAFQKLVNDLDPRGAKGTSQLQRMFPGDVQSVKDMHELADFMGRNQGSAGGMASGMAKLRLLGLKESALGLIANTAGFSWLLSKPGLARDFLIALRGGKDVVKISAAIGEINHTAGLSRDGRADEPPNNSDDIQASPQSDQPNAASAAQPSTATATTAKTNSNASSIAPPAEDSTTSDVPEGRVPVSIPGGKTFHFPSQEAADAFKKNAGIQ